jgi:hypothetical protein
MRPGAQLAVNILEDVLDALEEGDAMEAQGVIDYLKGEEFGRSVRQVRAESDYSHRWRRGFLSATTPRIDK